jgi:hypothetical protein
MTLILGEVMFRVKMGACEASGAVPAPETGRQGEIMKVTVIASWRGK